MKKRIIENIKDVLELSGAVVTSLTMLIIAIPLILLILTVMVPICIIIGALYLLYVVITLIHTIGLNLIHKVFKE